ncbi:hypothetical protein RJ639_030296 [Escallonia herrerae]|uniref:Selenoprotein H n=1 Tax=Escallonia herrerae TaxID=1293975 RepID=A0AA89BCG3_9ASTE|nr:hypothetical protein RJ639_030296 [Escallonia herrerae]
MKPTTAFSSRVTRSSTRRVNANNLMDSEALPDLPPAKKAKTGSNLTAKNVKAKKKLPAPAAKELELPASLDGSKTICFGDDQNLTPLIRGLRVSESLLCLKQCNAFKTRAIQVKNGLEDGLSGITVLLNPGKPRRGCFEIREEGGETFLSLLVKFIAKIRSTFAYILGE